MRIGVYVDGFNLYYGARGQLGRGTHGWRWIDLRGLATSLVARRTGWPGAQVSRVVYCTACIYHPAPRGPGFLFRPIACERVHTR